MKQITQLYVPPKTTIFLLQLFNPISLPPNYDNSLAWFLTILVAVVENRNSLTAADTEYGQRNPAYMVSAALSYTTQLTSQLSYYLGMHLPKRLCYR